MAIEYEHAVIHHLRKESKKPIEKPILRDATLNCESKAVRKLIDGVINLYGTKDNNAIFGTFAESPEEKGFFPASFEKFRSSNQSEQQFIDMTVTAMRSLQSKARDVNFASGGYILFASYTSDNKPFLLIAMIKQRDGIQLNDNLEPIGIQELDLNKLHQAARINIERYLLHGETQDIDEKEQLSYLSFVSPKTNQSASGYFIKALGCSGGVAASRATDTACREMANFFQSNSALTPKKRELKSAVFDYLRECAEEKQNATIGDLAALARRYFPATYSDDEKNELESALISELNSEDTQLPGEFRVHLATVNKHAKTKLKSSNWQLSFEKHSLGDDENAEIWFDKKNNRIVINELSDEIRRTLLEQ
ncbi:MAG: nucleoid-associated protein [Idiomarina sp. T82-3]|uniref:nucleoid-associated protein n=1 Tax=Idiomarina TaxID=135575 RepID=UPI0007969F03|nr:nucleoid-associated protein [Idiomarina sp. T82-3]KXS34072.1 MAG: nucleoid-associated protein [Idiomarina sp. T82-3]MEC7643847.1 nucleoid-associated protein [Pseudomonadota bacterium]